MILTTCVSMVLLLSAPHQEQPRQASPGKIVLTGKGAGYMKSFSKNTVLGADGTPKTTKVELNLTFFELENGQKLVVALPLAAPLASEKQNAGGADPDLQRLLSRMDNKAVVAVEGTLSSTDDPMVLSIAGAAGAKSVPMLVATTETKLDDANRKGFPAEGHARLVGVLAQEEPSTGAARWTVRIGEGAAVLNLPKGIMLPPAGERVTVGGKAGVTNARLVVTVTELQAAK